MDSFNPIWSAVTKAKLRAVRFEAKRWVGTIETGGDNRGQIVEMFQKAVDGVANREPWCMSFCQYCVKMVDALMDDRYDRTLRHKRDLFPSEHCMTTYYKSRVELRIDKPVEGCFILWRYYTKDGEKTEKGHVEIVTNLIDDQYVETVGGNTSSTGIVREGDGVFIKKRDFTDQYGMMRVEGFLLPWSYDELA